MLLSKQEENGGSTALAMASHEGQYEVAMALLEAKADMDHRDENGSTALVCLNKFHLVFTTSSSIFICTLGSLCYLSYL